MIARNVERLVKGYMLTQLRSPRPEHRALVLHVIDLRYIISDTLRTVKKRLYLM